MSFDELITKEIGNKDGIVILNFWATWCSPCVAELPHFIKAGEKYKGDHFRIIFANLDFNSKIKSTVEPFVVKRNMLKETIHINDTDPNQWINKIDSSWSGAIPATVIFKEGKKIFFKEGEMKSDELNNIILEILN